MSNRFSNPINISRILSTTSSFFQTESSPTAPKEAEKHKSTGSLFTYPSHSLVNPNQTVSFKSNITGYGYFQSDFDDECETQPESVVATPQSSPRVHYQGAHESNEIAIATVQEEGDEDDPKSDMNARSNILMPQLGKSPPRERKNRQRMVVDALLPILPNIVSGTLPSSMTQSQLREASGLFWPTGHNDACIAINENEPTSMIAYSLNSSEYRDKVDLRLREFSDQINSFDPAKTRSSSFFFPSNDFSL